MTDIDILRQLIKESVQVPFVNDYDKSKKKIKLTEPQHSNSSVTIYEMPDNVIIIKADMFKSPDTIFAGSRGECKRADFVIIADTNNKKVILCIEIKTAKGKEEEIIQQLNGARCFILYCREIGRTFWKQRDFLEGYEYRFVSVTHTGIDKKKTRIDRQPGVHDRPEKMLKISSPHHLFFNQLAGIAKK
jgi:hypothetical protein